jgi:protein-disulfide isomerase
MANDKRETHSGKQWATSFQYWMLGLMVLLIAISIVSLAYSWKTYSVVAGGTATVKTTVKASVGGTGLKADDPVLGSKNAKLTIIEYSDYQCPYCGRVEPTIKQVMSTYGDQVRLVFRDFPLSFHENAMPAALAANCAQDQGKFWEYHDLLFANQEALDAASLKKYATQVGLDATKFNDCFDTKKFQAAIADDMSTAQADGVQGTPFFKIGSQQVSGALPFDSFKKVIDAELAK